MSKRQCLCLLGVWIMVFPFLGFPSEWHWIITLVTGFIITVISYNLQHERRINQKSESSVFTENNNDGINA